MIQIKELEKYCKSKLLDFEIDGEILVIEEKEYQIVDDSILLFNKDFEFLPKSDFDVDGFVYQFGGRWYTQDIDEDTQLIELLNVGTAVQKLPTESFLGIHSGNELLNGVGLYEDWIKKAKFLGIKSLGICERGSLSGVIEFQNLCKKNGIKPITGMTIPIGNSMGTYEIKVYVQNFEGWQNLLKFSEILNIQEEPNVSEIFLMENRGGLQIVIDPKYTDFHSVRKYEAYYQLDTVIFDEEEKDIEYMDNLELYLKSNMKPVTLCDAYYIEQGDWVVREKLWDVAKSFDYKTKNQYFKNNDQYAKELIQMFDSSDKSWVKFFKEGVKNLNGIAESCDFIYDTTSRHLPKYKMTAEESEQFETNEELFMHLIKEGFKKKDIKDRDTYIARLKEEIGILKSGDVIDYFLVLYDIVGFAKSQDILVGIGRGSAGGSLVSYLLDIIQIDPISFDLLFARFLNPGRMGEWTECKAFEVTTDEGTFTLNEKSLVKVVRNQKEIPIFVEDLREGDELIKY